MSRVQWQPMFDKTNIAGNVKLAAERISPYVRRTMVVKSDYLSGRGGSCVYNKLENLQYTGSFKVRGAMNKLLSLDPQTLARGVVAASTGNHGAAVAYGLERLSARGVVFVPENAVPAKLEIIERLGAEVRRFGLDPAETEVHAREYASKHGQTFISPYNDPEIVCGQGTIGVELERQLEGIDVVLASVGGGGLISGIAGYLKSVGPGVRIVGCSPENSQVMVKSIAAGKILDLPSLPTISDGTAGGLEPGAITFDLCRELVDEFVTVTEDEIKDSLRLFVRTERQLIEGAAAVTVASYLKTRDSYAGKNVVLIICGANISPETLKEIL